MRILKAQQYHDYKTSIQQYNNSTKMGMKIINQKTPSDIILKAPKKKMYLIDHKIIKKTKKLSRQSQNLEQQYTRGEKHIVLSSYRYFLFSATIQAEEVWQRLLNIKKMSTLPAQQLYQMRKSGGKRQKKKEKINSLTT